MMWTSDSESWLSSPPGVDTVTRLIQQAGSAPLASSKSSESQPWTLSSGKYDIVVRRAPGLGAWLQQPEETKTLCPSKTQYITSRVLLPRSGQSISMDSQLTVWHYFQGTDNKRNSLVVFLLPRSPSQEWPYSSVINRPASYITVNPTSPLQPNNADFGLQWGRLECS